MDRRKDVREIVELSPVKKKKAWKKVLVSVLAVVLFLVFALVVCVMLYIHSIGINYVKPDNTQETISGDDALYDDLNDDEKNEYHSIITAIRDDSSLSSQLYDWYSNGGDHLSSSNVINILIIGVDSRSGEIEGNSDVMMLASVNKKQKSITLCSFLRDSYTYFERSDGAGYYSKLNAAFSYGGGECLVSAIENNYKIDIDYFVAVDFSSFAKIIDTIGGVNLDVEQFEAEAIEDYGKITGVPYGENVLLSGEQALLFARMRSIYASGDVQRTQNQRKVINAIIKKTKTLSIGELNNVVQTLGEYVYTDCPTTKIVSLGSSAILGKWYNYQVYSMEAPPESARKAYNGSTWMWLVDYPYSAQYVQKHIYGETNIVIQ